MAITIINQKTTNSFWSSANPITLTVNSTNSGRCNFRYICDVWIDNIKVYGAKLFPDPVTGYGFFQIDRICNDWIEALIYKSPSGAAWNPAGSAAVGAPTSVIRVQCKFGEEYDATNDCTGTTLQYANLSNSNQFYVFHSAIAYEDWPTFNTNDYVIQFASQSAATKFLTNSPREVRIGFNDPLQLDVMGATAPPTANSGYAAIRYRIYYKDNTVDTRIVPATTLANTKRWRIHAGSWEINRLYSATLISDATVKYLVDIVWCSGTPATVHQAITETFTFIPYEKSSFKTRILFLGALGSMEAYNFNLRKRTNYDVERRVFNRGFLRNYSNQWTYQVGDRGQSVAWSRVGISKSVASFVTKSESKWINEIWWSPEVYEMDLGTKWRFHTTGTGGNLDIWIEGEHNIVAGDTIIVFPQWRPDTEYLKPNFLTVLTAGERKIEVVWPYTTVTNYTGCIMKRVDWKILPIVVSDTDVEEKQKLERPIEYRINYTTSYPKITIK